MTIAAVMYPATESGRFDFDYYMHDHIPLVRRLWEPLGLGAVSVMRAVPAPDGAPPAYTLTALLTFGSMSDFEAAAAQHGAEIFADIERFTDAKPVIIFNEAIG